MLIFRPCIPMHKQGLIFTGWLLKIIPQVSQKPGMCYWHDHGTQISHAEGFRTFSDPVNLVPRGRDPFGQRMTKGTHGDEVVTLFNRFKTNWKVRSNRPKVWRHNKLNLWNYGIFWGIMKERHLGKRPTCQELTFQGKLSLSRSPWLVIGSCFGVLVQFCYSMLW